MFVLVGFFVELKEVGIRYGIVIDDLVLFLDYVWMEVVVKCLVKEVVVGW